MTAKNVATVETKPVEEVKEPSISLEQELKLHDITKPEPTVLGVFRKTNDSFQWMGKIADNHKAREYGHEFKQ